MIPTVANPVKLRQVMGVPNVRYHNVCWKDASDEDLMVTYGGGDALAFDELYHRNKGPLYRYFLRQTSQAALAEEFSHEVWLRIIKSRHSYIPKAKFTTYLFQIAHNCLVDHYRKQSTNQEVDCDDEVINDIPAHGQSNPEAEVDNTQAQQTLLMLISQLPAEQREVFVLKQDAGLSIEEIAYVIEENPETVKSRMRYAINKLKAGMQEFLDR